MTLVQSEPKSIKIWTTPIKKVTIRPNGTEKQIRPTLITTPWIYHNPTLWLISLSSDGENWITIADKNLGATQVYNDDTKSEANCWKFFQWWNNYGFPFAWAITKSSSQVDASTYWPWNYYSSSTFITRSSGSPRDRAMPQNDNLWWDTTNTLEARRWPCTEWYHIPSYNDFTVLKNIMSNWWMDKWIDYRDYLKMPIAWYRRASDASVYNTNSWFLFTSSPNWIYAYQANYEGSYWLSLWGTHRADAQLIRPFKNTPVQPDDSRTALYPTS